MCSFGTCKQLFLLGINQAISTVFLMFDLGTLVTVVMNGNLAQAFDTYMGNVERNIWLIN